MTATPPCRSDQSRFRAVATARLPIEVLDPALLSRLIICPDDPPRPFRQEPRVWTRSAPEGDDGGQSEGRGVIAGKFVVAGGDTSEVLQAVEGRLDPPALPIAALVVADLPLAAALAWDDRRDAALAEVSAQPVGVVALVGGQTLDPARRFGQHRRRGGHIAGVAGRQQEDAGAAEHIRGPVDS